MLLLQQVNWETIGKTWGPLGIGFVAFILIVIVGFKVVKQIILGTIADARQERDYARQQREREADAIVGALKENSRVMTEGFDEVLREIRGNQPRRR